MVKEITATLEITYPESTCQAELARVESAEVKTPQRHNAHACNMAQDANLHNLTAESIKIIITINSLDKADARWREKSLEAAAKQDLTDTLFKKLLSEHEEGRSQRHSYRERSSTSRSKIKS